MSRTCGVLPPSLCPRFFSTPLFPRHPPVCIGPTRVAATACALGILVVVIGLFPASLACASPGAPSGRGDVIGRVVSESGAPLAWVSVLIEGTSFGSVPTFIGAVSQDDGSFRIEGVPAGTWTVVARHVSFQEARYPNVVVTAGEEVIVAVELVERVRELQVVEVTVQRDIVEPKSEVTRGVDTDDPAKAMRMEMIDMIGDEAGTLIHDGELHIRGLRSNSVRQAVDGIAITDPQAGTSATLASRGLDAATVTLGGLGADVGQASGLIEYHTKEGGQSYEGELFYLTDDYGSPETTFDNLDRLFLGFGGPGPVDGLTFYAGVEMTYADWYPATPRDRSRRRLLEFVSLGDRKHNQLRMQTKLAYRPTSSTKLTAEVIKDDIRSDDYEHMWSRPGYVQLLPDTTQSGEVRWLAGRFSAHPVDSTYVYYNPANHTPTVDQSFRQMKLVWSHTLNSSAFYTLRLNRNVFGYDQRVRGKRAWEYEGARYADFWFNYTDQSSEPYFVVAGDYPLLGERETKVTTLRADLTKQAGDHTVKTGIESNYNDMQAYQVELPFGTSAEGEIGTRAQYHYYNLESAAYVMDSWRYEGMELNVGVRLDLFSIGNQLGLSEVRKRTKTQWSPRVGIAYPISDRDVFSFHYGRFYQTPQRSYLYDQRNAQDGRTQGNPNLDNETTVSYQAAVQHLFTNLVSAQVSVYYTDVFGQISTDLRPAFGSVNLIRRWENRDYASARGVEVSLKRRFDGRTGFALNYTFGVATGTASDPNALAEQDFAYIPTSEQPLKWDIRHKVNLSGTVASGSDWLASASLAYESGAPYTPIGRNTRETLPEIVNSRRLPSTTTLDVRAERAFSLWGQSFRLFVQGDNVLDARNLTSLSPRNWPPPTGWDPDNYVIYYTETGRTGGAYIGDDVDGDGNGDWVPLDDPRVHSSPRTVRTGFSFAF